MRRVFVSYSQPIRFNGKSVNRGLPVLDKARALDPCHRPEGSWALGTRMFTLRLDATDVHAQCLNLGEISFRQPYQYFLRLGSLSMHVFETRTATGSERFSLLTCLHTTAFALPSIFSPLGMLGIKIWKIPLSWHAKCPLPVVVASQKRACLNSLFSNENFFE